MNELELNELFAQAQDAFRSGELERAEALLRRVQEETPANSPLTKEITPFLRQLQHRELLAQIPTEPDVARKLDLINTAEELGLAFVVVDGREEQLAEIKAATQAQLSVIADDQAQATLAEGDNALEQWQWEEAKAAYERARDGIYISPTIRSEAEERLVQLNSRRGQFAEAERLLQEIPGLLAQADVVSAETKLAAARQLAGAHPRLDEMQQEVAAARQTLNNITQTLAQGEQKLRDGAPAAAETGFATARQIAQDVDWFEWVDQATQGLQKAALQTESLTTQLSEKRRQGSALLRDLSDVATDPEKAKELAVRAAATLKEADELAAKLELPVQERQPISALLEQADRFKKRYEAIERAQQYLREADFERAGKQLAEAESQGGADELIERLKRKIDDQKSSAETLKRTLAQRTTPYRSPTEMSRNLDRYLELFPTEEATHLRNLAPKLYWLQASADLRDRVHAIMERLETGPLTPVLEQARDAHKEWKEYYDPKEEERKIDSSAWLENRTLAARLAILDEQIRHLEMAEPAAQQFEGYLVTLQDSGSGDGLDVRLVQQGQEIWAWLEQENSPIQRYLLRGYARTLANLVIPPLRRQAQKVETNLSMALDQASSLANTNQLTPALHSLNTYKAHRDELERLDGFYRQISQADGSGSWTIQPHWKAWDTLHEMVEEGIRRADWLAEAREKMAAGEYETAAGLLERILDEEPTHVEAKKEKELATASAKLQKESNQAQSQIDYPLEIAKLEAVQQLDSRANWVVARLTTARARLRQQEEIERILATAEKHLNNGAYELVKQNLDKLEDKQEYLTSKQAQKWEEIRSQAEIQVTQADNIRKWVQEAREALKQCELDQAVKLTRDVLIIQPGNTMATHIQEWAQQVRASLERAKDQLVAADYLGAERNLLAAKRIGPGISGAEIEQLLGEARRLRSENQAASESLKQAEGAKEVGDWVQVLQLVMPVLAKLTGNTEHLNEKNGLEALRDEAVPALQKIIKESVVKPEPSQEEVNRAQAALQALQKYPEYLDETSRKADSALRIAHKILQARALLEKNQPSDAVGLLEPHAAEYNSEQFLAAYNAARFAAALYKARQIAPEQSVSIQDHQQAIEHLISAQQLRSKLKGTIEIYRSSHWENLVFLGDSSKSISAWLSDLSDHKTQLMVQEAINSGRLNDAPSSGGTLQPGAKTLLTTLRQSSAKENFSREISLIEQKMTEAANWRQTPEKTRRVVKECLKPLLPPQRNPGYPPAQELLTHVWETLRREAADLATEVDDVSSLAQAVDKYDLLIELDPPDLAAMQGKSREVKRNLDNKLDDVANRIQSALIDADLEKDACENLLREVRRIPTTHLEQRSNLRMAETDLTTRSGQISKASTHILKARQGVQNSLTHCQGSYEENVLTHLSNAELINPDVFVRRQEIGQLRREAESHQSKRRRIETESKPQYQAVTRMIRKGQPPYPGEEPPEKAIWRQFERKYGMITEPMLQEDATLIGAAIQWGQNWFDLAQEINRKWQREDPTNQYCLRPSFHAPDEPDPLDNEHAAFVEQKEQLAQFGRDIISALELEKQAVALDKQASEKIARATDDSMFQSAIEMWDKAISLYSETLGKLVHVSKRNVWAARMIDRQEKLKARFDERKKHLQSARTKAQDRLSTLEQTRQEARQQEADCGRNDIKCMELAIITWSELLILNPDDVEARERIWQLREGIDIAKKRRFWGRVIAGVGAAATIFLAVWAFLYFSQLGPYTSAPTPTATLTPTTTPLPVMTPTSLATATPLSGGGSTPTIASIPTAVSPLLPMSTPGSLTCVVTRRGWMRAKASNTSLGLNIFDPGTELLVFEKVTTDSEGEWYRIETLGESGFFQADLLACPESE